MQQLSSKKFALPSSHLTILQYNFAVKNEKQKSALSEQFHNQIAKLMPLVQKYMTTHFPGVVQALQFIWVGH